MRFQITQWCHDRIRQMMPHPKNCTDASAGTGRDTLFLTEIADPAGIITAMDIQEEAIRQTAERLRKNNVSRQVDFVNFKPVMIPELSDELKQEPPVGYASIQLICDSHENLNRYLPDKSQDLILFNLGYLPGGDHTLSTKAESTVTALNQSLQLLTPGGLLSVMIYSGGDSGFEEKEAVLGWARGLDPGRYLVFVEEFCNRPNNPPIPLYVRKI
ncbi:MAG: class I SAM-dependent methyltransferase [Eubacterium sp.]|nr:class I SAM-dependent methyltransferase [Eubacterium sp.]